MGTDNTDKIDISVIIPIYKNAYFIDELCSRLKTVLNTVSSRFEIILVNDYSPDNSWEIINKNAQMDPRIRGIRFSRNFGQHKAITAGLDISTGQWMVVMDGDLQDKPEEIVKLYQKAREGFDVVFARRKVRKDGFFKTLTSKLFYKVFDSFVEGHSDAATANFGIYSRKVIDNFKLMRENFRAFPLFVRWLGFKAAYVDVEHGERTEGKSSYTFWKRVNLATDAIISMSNKPLKYLVKLGFLLSFGSFCWGLYMILNYLVNDVPVHGWTSLIVSIYFLGGLFFSFTGILGLYIGKIFDEVKGRPIYVIDEVTDRV